MQEITFITISQILMTNDQHADESPCWRLWQSAFHVVQVIRGHFLRMYDGVPRPSIIGFRLRKVFERAADLLLVGVVGILVGNCPIAISAELVKVTLKVDATRTIDGRILAQAPDGRLTLEDRGSRIHHFKAGDVEKIKESGAEFSFLTDDELSVELLRRCGANFAIHQSEHFLICSDASELYTSFCGRLLDKVWSEYVEFFGGSRIKLEMPNRRLPVLIFRDLSRFHEFAKRLHPDTDFSDVPGFYSIRDNVMLIAAVSGDRSFRSNSDVVRELKKKSRQVETIVHEAIHQLAFNSGLQVRYADNAMWLTEGLAVYFENASRRGSLVWSRPGESSRFHLPRLKTSLKHRNRLELPLRELIASDSAFQSGDQLANAYAESWALTHYLISKKRPAFDELLIQLQSRKRFVPISAESRLQAFTRAAGQSISELEGDLTRHISRLRVR